MTVGLFVLTALGGGVGAALRYLADLGVTRLLGAAFPWGTLLVNVSGSLALGALAGATADATVLAVLGVGLLGGYTTFSSVAVASALFAQARRGAAAVANTLGTLVLTVAAAALGVWLGGLA